jgi:hypothetical protein
MYKVRPFERDIGIEGQAIRVRGIVADKGYILAVDAFGLEIKLGTTQFGMDEKGKFAVLEKGEQLVSDGSIVVEIEPYSEEPYMDTHFAPSGLEISVKMVASDKTVQAHEGICRSAGVDLGQVNLLVPHDWSFSVYFDSVGNVEGAGHSGLLKPEE